MIRLRVTQHGNVQGLWSDDLELAEIGPLSVRRASHVEFDRQMQCWAVVPIERPGDVLFTARSRANALRWEHSHFGPGGCHWNPRFEEQADGR